MRRAATRLVVIGLVGVAALFGFGGVAWAHAGGLTSSASEPVVLGFRPAAVDGVTVRAVEYGARLRLDNDSPLPVAVVPPAGTSVNTLPRVAPGGHAYWSDPRVTAASAGEPPPDGRRAWQIPLLVGAAPVQVVGEQRWPAPPPAGLWWLLTGLAAVLPAALVAALAGRAEGWARAVLAAATAVVMGAHVAHMYGSALVPEQGSFLVVFLAAAGFAVVGWPLGLAGAVLTARGRRAGPLLCCVAAALLAIIIAPADVFSFHDAVVPFAWGAGLDRVLIAATVGGGLGVVAAAWVLMRATPAARTEDAR